MKFYMFYLVSSHELYAYSQNKDYADIFEVQRKKDLFYRVTKEPSDKYSGMVFMNDMKSKQLIRDYLFDGHDTMEIICTMDESSKLSESCEYIDNTMKAIRNNSHLWNLHDKYLNIISNLTEVISKPKNIDSNPTLNVNTFKLFYHLFKHTFSDDVEEEMKIKL